MRTKAELVVTDQELAREVAEYLRDQIQHKDRCQTCDEKRRWVMALDHLAEGEIEWRALNKEGHVIEFGLGEPPRGEFDDIEVRHIGSWRKIGGEGG